MSAASTPKLSVQVLDFEDICLLIQLARLICDSCSSDQRFACSFLQIPPRDGHPCRPANDSPCRVRRRLSLPSECALPGAQTKKSRSISAPALSKSWVFDFSAHIAGGFQRCRFATASGSSGQSHEAGTKENHGRWLGYWSGAGAIRKSFRTTINVTQRGG